MVQMNFDVLIGQNPQLDRSKLTEIARLRDAVKKAGVRDNSYGLGTTRAGKDHTRATAPGQAHSGTIRI